MLTQGGRVLRVSREKSGKRPAVDLWFVLGLDDNAQATQAVTPPPGLSEANVEIVAVLTPDVAARWKLQHGEVRPPVSAP